MTRLLRSVNTGESQLILETGLDLKVGDMLGLAATNKDPNNSETVTVLSYNAQSGVVKLEEPLEGYHFG